MGNCMPIYRPNGTFPRVVPSELYIAVGQTTSPEDVAAAVDQMSFAEFAERMNEIKNIMRKLRVVGANRISWDMRREAFLSFFRAHI